MLSSMNFRSRVFILCALEKNYPPSSKRAKARNTRYIEAGQRDGKNKIHFIVCELYPQ